MRENNSMKGMKGYRDHDGVNKYKARPSRRLLRHRENGLGKVQVLTLADRHRLAGGRIEAGE